MTSAPNVGKPSTQTKKDDVDIFKTDLVMTGMMNLKNIYLSIIYFANAYCPGGVL